jgi:hypothetical protein
MAEHKAEPKKEKAPAPTPPDPQGGFVQTSGQIVSTQNEGWEEEVKAKSPQGKFGGA